MSEILSNVVVQPINSTITPEVTTIAITPEAINLNIFTSAPLTAGNSNIGELLYNSNAQITGIPTVTFTSGNLSLGNVANVKMTGGTNGYVLQTDGAGNLTWTNAPTANAGNGIPGGSNTQIQYNDAGLFGGSSGFTFNKVTGDVSMPADLAVVGNISGTIANANYSTFTGQVLGNSQPNITSVGSLTGLSVITTVNAGAFTGDGGGLSNVTAITVSNAAQPNITSLGTLTGLSIDGTLSIYEGIENVALIGAQTGTYNYDLLDGAIQYSTANATSNLVLNFRGNSTTTANSILANGKSITSTYLMTTGANAVGITGLQIDSANANIRWAGNAIPTFYGNTIQSYTFTIIKTSTSPTYTVLGSTTRYG